MLLVGIICGVIMFALIKDDAANILVSGINDILSLSTKEQFVKLTIILNAAKNNTLLIIIMIFLSITIVGKGCIYAITLVKGIIIGIYTSILLKIFGAGYGTMVILMQVVLVNIIYIPAYIYLAVELIVFNMELFKIKSYTMNLFTKIAAKITIAFVIMFSSSIIEQIFTNISLNIYSKL